MSIAVVVAVEEYAAKGIENIRFARNDGEQFFEAFRALGLEGADQNLLIDGAATKGAVESTLRAAVDELTEGDAFYLYCVGHGFHEGGRNFLACHDTNPADPAATSIKLEWIFELLAAASCGKVTLFLDSCHGGPFAVGGDEHLGGRADAELEEFFGGAEGRVCFASSSSEQISWGSRQNKHGAWANNVIAALRGNATSALENGTLLTSKSLELYVASAVQKTLRGDFVEPRDQTPWSCGAVSSEFLLADFGELIQSRRAASRSEGAQVARLSFCGKTSERIKKLSGFQKHQRVPTEVNRYAQALAREASSQEIEQDLEGVYRRLRDEFDLRRKDLDKVGPLEGGGSVVCPYFAYSIYVEQDPDDPSRVVFHRELSDISDPERVLESAFTAVFDGMFGSLRFSPPVRIDLKDFIDRVEGFGDDLKSLDFDPGSTYCNLRLHSVDAMIEVTSTEILFVHDSSKEPRVLLEAFLESQRLLVDTRDIRQIAFGS